MTDKERLIELIVKLGCEEYGGNAMCDGDCFKRCKDCKTTVCVEDLAEQLIKNGVIVLPCKPMPVMSDGNPFNSDVYCPFCGANLSGFYGDEPTSTIQCYGCGEFLDNTKSITREEAEKALKERGRRKCIVRVPIFVITKTV